MAIIELKGLHTVKSSGRVYYYAWRGGPRLKGEPGSAQFNAAYNEAIATLAPADDTSFATVVRAYRASAAYKKLADSTKRNWSRCLDEIESYFGTLRTVQFDRPEKIRPVIRRWRNKWAEKPRTADYHMQVLSRVISHGVDPMGVIAGNPCEGIKHMYAGDRSEIIWQAGDIAKIKGACPIEVARAVDLASRTGLRLADLLRLSWSHIGEHAITITTGKSNHRRTAVIPLYDDLRRVLNSIPQRSPILLTNSLHRPWTVNSFGTAFDRAKARAKMSDANLHFHDLRGTAATHFYLAGMTEREIAEILGWDEAAVSKIIRRYVARNAAVKSLIERLNRAGTNRAEEV